MRLELPNNKDFWAGMMLTGIGALALFIARNYRSGTAGLIGPGFFPRILGGILIMFGLYIMVIGLRKRENIQGHCSFRALILLPLSLVLFGVLMQHVGFIPALAVLIFGSAASGRQFKFVEVLLLAMLLTGLSVLVFVWGLGLPYPLIKGF